MMRLFGLDVEGEFGADQIFIHFILRVSYSNDGVHRNGAGHDLRAQVIDNWIAQEGYPILP